MATRHEKRPGMWEARHERVLWLADAVSWAVGAGQPCIDLLGNALIDVIDVDLTERRTRLPYPLGNRAHFQGRLPEAPPVCAWGVRLTRPTRRALPDAQTPAPQPKGWQPGPLPQALARGGSGHR